MSELESLFSATVPKPADSGKAGGRRKSVGSKPDKVHLVIQSFKYFQKNFFFLKVYYGDSFIVHYLFLDIIFLFYFLKFSYIACQYTFSCLLLL